MSWSWKLGRIAGIDVFVHATFLILLLWVALSEYLSDGSAAAAATAVPDGGDGVDVTRYKVEVTRYEDDNPARLRARP
jgi:hypothetical protein